MGVVRWDGSSGVTWDMDNVWRGGVGWGVVCGAWVREYRQLSLASPSLSCHSRADTRATRASFTRGARRVARSSWQGHAMPGLLRTTLACLLVGVVAVELLRNAHDADRDVDRGTIDTSIEIKRFSKIQATKSVRRVSQGWTCANDRSRARGIVGCAPGRPSAELSAEKDRVWRI